MYRRVACTGILLMLPIGLIIALTFYYVFSFAGGFLSGQFVLIFLTVSFLLAVARILLWRTRRRYWRQLAMNY